MMKFELFWCAVFEMIECHSYFLLCQDYLLIFCFQKFVFLHGNSGKKVILSHLQQNYVQVQYHSKGLICNEMMFQKN